MKKLIGKREFYATVIALALPLLLQNAISTFVNLLRSCDGMSVESKEATDDDEEDQVILWLYFRNIWRCG